MTAARDTRPLDDTDDTDDGDPRDPAHGARERSPLDDDGAGPDVHDTEAPRDFDAEDARREAARPASAPEPLRFESFQEMASRVTFTPCPACGGLTAGRPGFRCWDCEQKRERQRASASRARELSRSIPENFAWARFEERDLAARVAHARDFVPAAKKHADAFVRRIVFRGAPGTGKTSLMVAMVRAWAARRDAVALFVPATYLSGKKFQLDAHLLTAPLVMIDDVGMEADIKSNTLPELVYERHARGRALWVTTNRSMEQLIALYQEGIARRLHEAAAIFDFDTGEIL